MYVQEMLEGQGDGPVGKVPAGHASGPELWISNTGAWEQADPRSLLPAVF